MGAARFLAVDPGRDTGWSLWEGHALVACGLGAFPCDGVRAALIEKPQVYDRRHSKGDPNDLITLAIQVGQYKERLERAGASVSLVLPRAWKGTVDPNIMLGRIIRDMSPAAAAIVSAYGAGVAKSRLHNVIDAIGLGQWALRTQLWVDR